MPWLEADGTWNVPATYVLVVFIQPLARLFQLDLRGASEISDEIAHLLIGKRLQ